MKAMKYTNQIINGDVNVKGLISNRKYLKPATIMMTIPIAIFGLALLPAAGMDLVRYVKFEYHKQVKLYHRIIISPGQYRRLQVIKTCEKKLVNF